jgi:predicted DNA-binding protein
MAILSIRLSEDLERRLELEAQRSGQHRSAIIRALLERNLPTEEELQEARARWERVRHLIGSVDSGLTDLGSNHEEHLRRIFDERRAEIVGHGPAGEST